MDIIIILIKFMSMMLAALIAGSTFYISLVEVPARTAMGAPVSPASWRETFPRAARAMKALGFTTMPLFALTFVLTWNALWLLALLPFVALGPYTGMKIAPTNNRLLDESLDLNSPEAQELTQQWGRLHLNRTYMACAGLALALIAGLT